MRNIKIAEEILKDNLVLEDINNTKIKVAYVELDQDNSIKRYYIKDNYTEGETINFTGLYIYDNERMKKLISKQDEIKESNKKYLEYLKKKEQEEQEQRKLEEKERIKDNFTNGYADKLSPMQKAKIINTLNKTFRYDDKDIRMRKDNIIIYLRSGYLPKEKNVTYSVNGKYQNSFYKNDYDIKTKNIYVLINDKNEYLEITKIEYDYANYILNSLGLENAKLTSEL